MKSCFGELVETELVREVFDVEPRCPLRDEAAKPWAATFLRRKRSDRACEESHALDGAMEGDVEAVDDPFPVRVGREGEAEDTL